MFSREVSANTTSCLPRRIQKNIVPPPKHESASSPGGMRLRNTPWPEAPFSGPNPAEVVRCIRCPDCDWIARFHNRCIRWPEPLYSAKRTVPAESVTPPALLTTFSFNGTSRCATLVWLKLPRMTYAETLAGYCQPSLED